MDPNFWYFALQVGLELIGIWVGLSIAIKLHLDQLRADIASIKRDLALLRQASDTVVDKAMTYFTSKPDRETIWMIEDRKTQGIDRVKRETLFEIKELLLLCRELEQLGLQPATIESLVLDGQLSRIIERSAESISRETEAAVKFRLFGVARVARREGGLEM